MEAMNNPAGIRAGAARRWRCACAYDGAGFAGWQSQPGGSSVQDALEAALGGILGGAVRVHGSGRTDAGVHAMGQVFHFDAAWRHGPDRLLAALRSRLPASIQVRSVRPAAAGFHARFSAKGKVYTYDVHLGDADPFTRPRVWVVDRPLDLDAMRRAAGILRGRHDFRAFSARRPGEEDTVRDLRRLEVTRRGRTVRITAEADGFLYKMVRSLAGALVSVGQGKLTAEAIGRLLEARERTPAVMTAPPQGLCLRRVFY
jgi:tRNA pseudouridine38-40 synthase